MKYRRECAEKIVVKKTKTKNKEYNFIVTVSFLSQKKKKITSNPSYKILTLFILIIPHIPSN
jgi:hypothetical protein